MSGASAALQSMVQGVELEEITFRELSAVRADEDETVLREHAGAVPKFALGIIQDGDDETRFELRLRCEISFPDGSELVAEPRARYQVLEDSLLPLSKGLLVEFANEVAVMALIPYLRQAVADLSQRVFGAVLLMPVMQRGEVSFVAD